MVSGKSGRMGCARNAYCVVPGSSIFSCTPRVQSLILALGLGAGRAVLAHSRLSFSTPWDAPERDVALAGIGAADDVPIARRLMVCRESEHRFERGMPVEAAIVAE